MTDRALVPAVGADLGTVGEVLRQSQVDLVGRGDSSGRLSQVGGAVIAGSFPLPCPEPTDATWPAADEAVIDTFVVDERGAATSMGGDPRLGAWWQPMVEELVGRANGAALDAGVALDGPGYVTVSTTPLSSVVAAAHVDDDQYHPGRGVGLVAIAASHAGPRLAVEPVEIGPPRAGLPLDVAAALDRFAGPDGPVVQQAPAERIVVFPRFGQVHAGPSLTGTSVAAGPVRCLLVYRIGTTPVR